VDRPWHTAAMACAAPNSPDCSAPAHRAPPCQRPLGLSIGVVCFVFPTPYTGSAKLLQPHLALVLSTYGGQTRMVPAQGDEPRRLCEAFA